MDREKGGGRGRRGGDFCPFRWQTCTCQTENMMCAERVRSVHRLLRALTHIRVCVSVSVCFSNNLHVFPDSESQNPWTLRITCQVISSMSPPCYYWYCIHSILCLSITEQCSCFMKTSGIKQNVVFPFCLHDVCQFICINCINTYILLIGSYIISINL